MRLRLEVNGSAHDAEIRADETLLEVLRRDVGLGSVRETCGIGVCGACTALVDGELLSTCLVLAPLADRRAVTTVEGLSRDDPVVRAFAAAHAFQCGYCTPGMVLSARRLLEENPAPTRAEIAVALGGNLCRCGCYVKILDAVEDASRLRLRSEVTA
jgi:aerobic-type carbon monoxide dehydrogenase small subunit (CoxS/CutS family)